MGEPTIMNHEQHIGQPCPWRHTAETPKFGPIDARAMFPIVLVAFHARMWTLQLAIAVTVGFAILGIWRITPLEGLKAFWLWAASLGFRRGHIGHRRGIYRESWD